MSNLTPSAVVTFFEMDFNELLKNSTPDKKLANVQPSNRVDYSDGILRFHNNANIFNSYIIWRGQKYFPAPINAEGFEVTSRGTLPRPTLSIASQSKDGIDQISLLRHEIRSFGDLVGTKVTRRKTYAKYLDKENFSPVEEVNPDFKSTPSRDLQQLPEGYEPDPYAEMPPDIYFIERKINENKMILSYQLSSALDLEGYKLPKRVIISDKCMWQYRGIGCWYQHVDALELTSSSDPSQRENGTNVPLLQKAELIKLPGDPTKVTGVGLPGLTPPCSNDLDEKLTAVLGSSLGNDKGEWSPFSKAGGRGGNLSYKKGDYCYLIKNKIKFYFVAKVDISHERLTEDQDIVINAENPPPNTDYWIADECSKTLTGCRMRWGTRGSVQNDSGLSSCGITKGELPFGGFPAARKVYRGS
jgi:lambda family phage minor tail protein L